VQDSQNPTGSTAQETRFQIEEWRGEERIRNLHLSFEAAANLLTLKVGVRFGRLARAHHGNGKEIREDGKGKCRNMQNIVLP